MKKTIEKDEFTREWITGNAIDICSQYEDGVLTLRALHYQLVAIGMTNTMTHYKRVVGAMIKARKDGVIRYEQFSDHDRAAIGSTDYESESLDDAIETGKRQIKAWMNNFDRGRWENQKIIPEIWIEKKALQGVFEPVCTKYQVALAPCKGYPSLTFLNDAANRFKGVIYEDKKPIILYFGDYDATGEDIPRSIQSNLIEMGVDDIEVRRIALMEDQVIKMKLPPAPTKESDSRAKNWDGLGQVELDAVNPKVLQKMIIEALDDVFDEEVFNEMKETLAEELKQYRSELKAYVNDLDTEE